MPNVQYHAITNPIQLTSQAFGGSNYTSLNGFLSQIPTSHAAYAQNYDLNLDSANAVFLDNSTCGSGTSSGRWIIPLEYQSALGTGEVYDINDTAFHHRMEIWNHDTGQLLHTGRVDVGQPSTSPYYGMVKQGYGTAFPYMMNMYYGMSVLTPCLPNANINIRFLINDAVSTYPTTPLGGAGNNNLDEIAFTLDSTTPYTTSYRCGGGQGPYPTPHWWSKNCCYDPQGGSGTYSSSACSGACIGGCTDPNASNYDPTAQCDDGSCSYPLYHEWRVWDNNCNDMGIHNVIAVPSTLSVASSTAFWAVHSPNVGQFISHGLMANQRCIEYVGTSPTSANNIINSSFGLTNQVLYNDCAACRAVYGCTDPNAGNYNSNATIDDGSCTYPPVYGCTDPTANNYNSSANTDDGSCTYTNGCTDPTACNYDSTAVVDDGSCCFVSGCTGSQAVNYDPTACCDDGSCIYTGTIYGCTDPIATNYNPNATNDNGTCVYTDPPVFNSNPCDTIDITTITPNSCDLLHIAHTWSSRVSTGTGGCLNELIDDLIMSVALYDMLEESVKIN